MKEVQLRENSKEKTPLIAQLLFKKNVSPEVLETEDMVQNIVRKKNGQMLVDVVVDNKKSFFRWIFQYEDNVSIISPTALRSEMKGKIGKMAQLYESRVKKQK